MRHESDIVSEIESERRAAVDVRPEEVFRLGHWPQAASMPLEELRARLHELPPPGEALAVVDADPARAEAAAAFLREREYRVETAALGARPATEAGPSRARLWRPNPFLLEALARMGPGGRGRALDLACGSGRDAVFLALEGFDVEAIDVLPDALERAADLARRSGVRIATAARDVERDPALEPGRYALVVVFHFLWRPLFPAIRAAVAPGGHVVYETFHERTRETGRRPFSKAHLLREGELLRELGSPEAGFAPLLHRDGALVGGRYVSSLCARKNG